MKNSAILRTAKVGGFNKDDVLTYVDELNAKIESLKNELEKSKASQADAEEIENYKNGIESLRERLSEAEEKLSEAESKLSEARANSDSERNELQNQKNAVVEENNNLKNEIEALKYQLESAQSSVQEVPVESFDTSEYENKISNLSMQLENAKSQINEMSGELRKLVADNSDKNRKIDKLRQENEELRQNNNNDSGFGDSFDMSALFSEAQATARKIVVEAKAAADKLVRDAQKESDRILRDARDKAERTNAEAVGKAAIMEDEARKNTYAAVSATENLKKMFMKESVILDEKLSELIDNVERTSKRFIRDIEASKKEISQNVADFINNKNSVDGAAAEAMSALKSMPDKFSMGENTEEQSYNDFSEITESTENDVYADEHDTVLTDSYNEYGSDDLSDNYLDSESENDSDINSYAVNENYDFSSDDGYLTADSYINDESDNEPDAFDSSAPEMDIEEIKQDLYEDNPYISMVGETPDTEIDNEQNDAAEHKSGFEMDDILSSFSIDPVADEEEEPAPIPKKTASSLGFDLGDLAKLAEEAEKGL